MLKELVVPEHLVGSCLGDVLEHWWRHNLIVYGDAYGNQEWKHLGNILGTDGPSVRGRNILVIPGDSQVVVLDNFLHRETQQLNVCNGIC